MIDRLIGLIVWHLTQSSYAEACTQKADEPKIGADSAHPCEFLGGGEKVGFEPSAIN